MMAKQTLAERLRCFVAERTAYYRARNRPVPRPAPTPLPRPRPVPTPDRRDPSPRTLPPAAWWPDADTEHAAFLQERVRPYYVAWERLEAERERAEAQKRITWLAEQRRNAAAWGESRLVASARTGLAA